MLRDSLIKETIILVPRLVYKKARELRELGLYRAAIELIEENKIELQVWDERKVKRSKAA